SFMAGVVSGNGTDRRKQPNPTSFQRFEPYPPTPRELFGLEWFVGVLQGNVARSLAIIAVCFLGFLFLTGRMAWQGAISIVIGIAIIFGAAELVDAMKTAGGV
ncbi:TrbC/VirB2 family protein, partial [Shinella sp. 838]|uniref:TrbC/VirB2 family protein n=1 Tax=Shinella sp. 838 TaxID=3038164 RepID=UPI002414D764